MRRRSGVYVRSISSGSVCLRCWSRATGWHVLLFFICFEAAAAHCKQASPRLLRRTAHLRRRIRAAQLKPRHPARCLLAPEKAKNMLPSGSVGHFAATWMPPPNLPKAMPVKYSPYMAAPMGEATSTTGPLTDMTNAGAGAQWTAMAMQPVRNAVDECYSRKVFIGGLPPDIDEETMRAVFGRIGAVMVDWPHKDQTGYQFPPQGYAFLIFECESSVRQLIKTCRADQDKYYMPLSSVQVRPWKLSDAHLLLNHKHPSDHRNTVFVGGVPRPTTAAQLATLMEKKFGGVCDVAIDVDNDHKYPKGAARVSFASRRNYVAAVASRFVSFNFCSADNKQMEVKPFMLECAPCDRCETTLTRHFCASLHCLQYLCVACWMQLHTGPLSCHKPMVKNVVEHTRQRRHSHQLPPMSP